MSGAVMRALFDADHAAFADTFDAFVERDAAEPDAFARAGKAGLLGMQVADRYGGGDIDDPRFCAVAVEKLVARGRVGFALAYAGHVGVGQATLSEHGSTRQQEEWLTRLASGDAMVAVTADAVTAEPAGEEIVLHGTVAAVVNGASADLLLLPLEPDGVIAVIPTATPGLSRTAVEGLALTDAHLADIEFDAVRLSQSDLLPQNATEPFFASLRLWAAVASVAGARTALGWTRAYIRDRKVFGRPVSGFENTRQVLGGLSADVLAAEGHVDQCLRAHGESRLRPEDALAAKLVGSELFGRAADRGLQLHGGYGYMREYPISLLFADARFLRWYAGANEQLALELADSRGL
ncbi:hypothetical protein FPZ12_016810 [Amycolatopsis acidicola]|uniref:Acyl-CoA dehydrogenase n=1 Tax=Amycolatopsis acidicola TaxID=2596893 RepID=A0A5N0V3D7_9PSEU|nr:acyl-CoA dehydrogenase family protein [Amycolatopsis acidicola]KAA9160495.1 hypothetical protein FPZ12_016810 [Amycolatopsis acidicola]